MEERSSRAGVRNLVGTRNLEFLGGWLASKPAQTIRSSDMQRGLTSAYLPHNILQDDTLIDPEAKLPRNALSLLHAVTGV